MKRTNALHVSMVIALFLFSGVGFAAAPQAAGSSTQGVAAHGAAQGSTHASVAGEEHPTVPRDPSAWAGTMLIIIGAMFLMAAVIGPIVRAEMPAETAPDHSHDEHHGHGHDHGASDHHHGHGHGH